MKILFFVDRLLHGGIQTLLLNLIREFKKNHPDMIIDFLNFDYHITYDLEITFKEMGCNIYKVPIPNRANLIKSLVGLNDFFKYHHDYDVIHAHCSSKGVFPLFFAKKNGIKIRIAHSHNTQFQSSNPLVISIGNILKRPLQYLATDYFACSDLAGKWLFGNNSSKIKSIYILNNGIILNDFLYNTSVRKELRNKYNIAQDVTVIGHVGRFSTQKNHKFLIQIFKEYHIINPKSILFLVGIGDLMDDIKKEVGNLYLTQNVIFAGFQKESHKFYQAFDCFLMPSLFEGLPFVGIEAQTSGLPCVFSDTVTKEVKVLDSTCFVSLDEKPIVWAKTVHSLISIVMRHNVYSEMSNAGYNISFESEKLYEYYENRINDER